MLKKILLIVVLALMVGVFVGCQTVQGLGEDIKWAGEKGAEVLQ